MENFKITMEKFTNGIDEREKHDKKINAIALELFEICKAKGLTVFEFNEVTAALDRYMPDHTYIKD